VVFVTSRLSLWAGAILISLTASPFKFPDPEKPVTAWRDQGKISTPLEGACLALKQLPEEASSLDELSDTLRLWNSLYGPLILLDACQGCRDREVEIAVDQARDLLAYLSVNHHQATA
jgi:hypothetical protein